MDGTYTKRLNTGCSLSVEKDHWTIEYFFFGPDRRYNPETLTIRDSQIDSYISAWKKNFNKFQELKAVLPKDDSFFAIGEHNMSICVNSYDEGVQLHHWGRAITKQAELDAIVKDYEEAKEIAKRIQAVLKDL